MISKGMRGMQNGVTLVELMVALVITLILSAGVIQIFLSSSQSYRLHEAVSRIQENARFAIWELQREVRMAGFVGCAEDLFNWLDPAGDDFRESLMGGQAVAGWEAHGTAPGSTLNIADSGSAQGTWLNGSGEDLPPGLNPVPETDVLVINRAIRLPVTLSGNPGGAANTLLLADVVEHIAQGDIIAAVAADCSGGDMWQVVSNLNGRTLPKGTATGFSPGNRPNAGQGFRFTYDDQAAIYGWESKAFYVRRNSTTGQRSLYMRRLGPGGNRVDELVEGVENMQVLYGLDSNNSGRPDRYEPATSVEDWRQVVSVRVSLLLHSAEGAVREADERAYHLIGTRVTTPPDTRLRQVATTTIAIRNGLE